MRILYLVLMALMAQPAFAELSNAGDNGFTVTHSIETDAKPFVAYRTMTSHIDEWWSPDHTWSGDASNLYMKVERGGCFCERLPNDGRVEHLRLIYFAPGSELRFDGALGPLQGMGVQGRMIWKIEALEAGSRITFTYHVWGHPEGGLAAIAPAVDGVIGQQLAGLGKRLAWNDH